MIYFRIEMWPYGDHEKRYTLTEGTIANVGGDVDTGHYKFAISEEGGFSGTDEEIAYGDALGVLFSGEEKDFPRQLLEPIDLLFRVLRRVFGERNQ